MKIKNGKRFAIAMFLAGVLTSALLVVVLSGLGGIRLVPTKKYDYYQDMDKELGKYYKISRTLKEDALYKYDDSELDDIIATGMLSGLKKDKYAQYMNKEAYSDMRKRLFDSYIGIGVGIAEKDNSIVVVTVTKDGPAENAGIKVGDVVKRIDGTDVSNVDEAIAAIEGKLGTSVKIQVERKGKKRDVSITRSNVEQDSVFYKVYKGDIGYIQITAFRDGTSSEFDTAVSDLKNKGCTKLIVDLRNNGGGITKEGIKVADQLLPACQIVSCHYRNENDTVENSKASDTGCKFVLLVNENTASASEIVTAAVKDNKAGEIIGRNTYGKGLIQSITPFKDGTGMKFTIGEYHSPKGHKINGKGIKPDIEADDSEILSVAVKALKK